MRRQAANQVKSHVVSSSFSDGSVILGGCSHSVKRSITNSNVPGTDASCCSLDQESENTIPKADDHSQDLTEEATCNTTTAFNREYVSSVPNKETRKKAKKSQQLSLRSFFQKSPNLYNGNDSSSTDFATNQTGALDSINQSQEAPNMDERECSPTQNHTDGSAYSQNLEEPDGSIYLEKEKNNVALLEWQRIQLLMQNSIPLCKGHREPCVSRVVKKPGPTFGHRFYACARAEVCIFHLFINHSGL